MQKAPLHRRSWIERTHLFVVHHPHLVWADMRVQQTNKQGNKSSYNALRGTLRYFSHGCWWLPAQLGSWPIKKRRVTLFWTSETIKITCRALQVVYLSKNFKWPEHTEEYHSLFFHTVVPTALVRNILSSGKPPVLGCSISTPPITSDGSMCLLSKQNVFIRPSVPT